MSRWVVAVASALGFSCGVATIPHRIAERDAARGYYGDAALQESSARAVDAWIRSDLSHGAFATGSRRFDGEWRFGTFVMGALGFAQVAFEHPDTAMRQRPRIERALDAALDASARAFDSDAWNEDALTSSASDRGHAAYLGYLGLALGLHRELYSDSKYAALHDAIADALVRRVTRSPTLLVETYPSETYPVDNTAVIAAIAVHAKALRQPTPAIVARWVTRARHSLLDPRTGLLPQSATPQGLPFDAPRGSGTALASYFLSFADIGLSRDLHRSVERELAMSVAGFEGVREYPDGRLFGGDIDSGPVVFGFSISATGFALAGCRIHADEECFRKLWATLDLFGAPRSSSGVRSHVSGGPLADALMFALATAQRIPS